MDSRLIADPIAFEERLKDALANASIPSEQKRSVMQCYLWHVGIGDYEMQQVATHYHNQRAGYGGFQLAAVFKLLLGLMEEKESPVVSYAVSPFSLPERAEIESCAACGRMIGTTPRRYSYGKKPLCSKNCLEWFKEKKERDGR